MGSASLDKRVRIGWCFHCNTPVLDQRDCICCGEPSTRFTNTQIVPIFKEEIELINRFGGADLPTDGLLFGYNHLVYGQGQLIGRFSYKRDSGWQFVPKEQALQFPEPTDPKVFVAANAEIIAERAETAKSYIAAVANSTREAKMVLTDFSGGKDSLVVTTLVRQVFPDAQVIHIYDPTVYPETTEYVEKTDGILNLDLVYLSAPGDFWSYCEVYGFPSVFVRWCCKLFRFIPVARYLLQLQRQGVPHVLEFQGIRASESYWRAAYGRERSGHDTFIRTRTVAFPVFEWSHLDVWAYILANGLPHNALYRKGWRRVGCWACPFISEKEEGLLRTYYPAYAQLFDDFLFQYAKQLGRGQKWVTQRMWRTRYAERARRVITEAKQCTSGPHTRHIRLPSRKAKRILEFSKVLGPVKEISGGATVIDCFRDEGSLTFELDADKAIVTIVANGIQLQEIQKVTVKALNCTGCGFCLSSCPNLALDVDKERGYLIVDEAQCTFCFQCYQTQRKHYLYGCHNLAMLSRIEIIKFSTYSTD